MKVCEHLNLIRQLQANHKDLILCGSVALILADVLPDRSIGDIDFVTNNRNIINELNLTRDAYADEVANGGYLSYSVTQIRQGFGLYKLNVLIFNPCVSIETETIKLPGGDLVCQRISDIIHWKEKYNRTKDIIDLDNMSLNMLEKAVFDKK
jgi:hypothetical protein